MAYLKSNQITMYPSSFREHSQDPNSYLSTEFNLTQTKRLSEDKDLNSYVIEEGEHLCIYLNGYYFKALKSDVVKFGSPLWAYIKVINETIYYREDTSATFESPRLVNLENDGAKLDTDTTSTSVFKGIAFVTNEPISDYTYKIQVLDDEGNLVESSKMKLKSFEIKDTSGSPITKVFHTDSIETNDISIANLEEKNCAIKVDSDGQLKANSLETDDPTIDGEASSFISTISQTRDGKIVATKKKVKGRYTITVDGRTLFIKEDE